MTFDELRALAMRLPGVEDGASYGTPALKVRGKRLVRLLPDEDAVVLNVAFLSRDVLLRERSDVFYFTDHYRDYPVVLARLAPSTASLLWPLLESAWRALATRAAVRAYDLANGA